MAIYLNDPNTILYIVFTIVGITIIYKFLQILPSYKIKSNKNYDDLMNLAITTIKSYPHNRKYSNEHYYHHMLYGYMQNHFKHIVIEEQIDDSRPDITIGTTDIAIEVKGPTTSSDLDSIYFMKCKKYPKIYSNMIVVLFDIETRKSKYDKWYNNMKTDYPDVVIIRKELNVP